MKHHFLLFRHCVRSTSLRIDIGLDGYSDEAADYVADPMPDWEVPDNWCTPIGLDLMEKTGAWLVNSGIVTPGSHLEFISDSMHRDTDTAYSLSEGMKGELNGGSTVPGVDVVRTEKFMFHPSRYEVCEFERDGIDEDVQNRIEHLRRPDLDFTQGLQLLDKIAGIGKVGNLSQYVPTDEPEFLYDDWNLTGAASLLAHFAHILFYSKAGFESSRFAPHATVQEVYQILQFAQWYWSVINIDNKWSATDGAAWAKIALTVLSKGSLYNAPPNSDSATIFLGHDTDLDVLSTVLRASWNPPEYQTHPEFTPTPPGSGVHIVRDTETDEIEVSFVYPVYHKEGLESWKTDTSGNIKQVPVLWKDADLFESNDQAGVVPSLQQLESHFLSTLDKYPGATDCFYATAKHLNENPATVVDSATSSSISSKIAVSIVAPIAFVFFLASLLVTRRLIRSLAHQRHSETEVETEVDNGEYV